MLNKSLKGKDVAKKHYIQFNVSPPKSSETDKRRHPLPNSTRHKTELQNIYFSDLNHTLTKTMKKHFENAQNLANVVIPSAYIKECHGTLRADDKLSPMEFQATNSNNFARQDCVSEPIEDVSRGAPAAGDGGD